MKAKELLKSRRYPNLILHSNVENCKGVKLSDIMDEHADIKAKEAYESHVWAKRHIEKAADVLDVYASQNGGFSALAPKLKMLAKRMNNYEQWKSNKDGK